MKARKAASADRKRRVDGGGARSRRLKNERLAEIEEKAAGSEGAATGVVIGRRRRRPLPLSWRTTSTTTGRCSGRSKATTSVTPPPNTCCPECCDFPLRTVAPLTAIEASGEALSDRWPVPFDAPRRSPPKKQLCRPRRYESKRLYRTGTRRPTRSRSSDGPPSARSLRAVVSVRRLRNYEAGSRLRRPRSVSKSYRSDGTEIKEVGCRL